LEGSESIIPIPWLPIECLQSNNMWTIESLEFASKLDLSIEELMIRDVTENELSPLLRNLLKSYKCLCDELEVSSMPSTQFESTSNMVNDLSTVLKTILRT